MYRHLLVALGNADYRGSLIWKAADLARTTGARMTFCSTPARAGFLHQGAELAREMLTKADAAARALGVPSSIMAAPVHPCQMLQEAVATRHCDLLVMSSNNDAEAYFTMIDSAAVAGIPALVFPAAKLAPSTAQGRVTEWLRAGPDCMSMMLHLWLRVLDRDEACCVETDDEVMTAIVQHLQSLAASPHHAYLRALLFRRLRELTAVVNAELDELESLHALDEKLLASLNSLLARHMAGRAGVHELKTAVCDYANFFWQRAGREENVIIPVAQSCLQVQDWAQLAESVGEDWLESAAIEHETVRLLSRIIDAATA
jgi:hemerythrin-like domain-containing protein